MADWIKLLKVFFIKTKTLFTTFSKPPPANNTVFNPKLASDILSDTLFSVAFGTTNFLPQSQSSSLFHNDLSKAYDMA